MSKKHYTRTIHKSESENVCLHWFQVYYTGYNDVCYSEKTVSCIVMILPVEKVLFLGGKTEFLLI